MQLPLECRSSPSPLLRRRRIKAALHSLPLRQKASSSTPARSNGARLTYHKTRPAFPGQPLSQTSAPKNGQDRGAQNRVTRKSHTVGGTLSGGCTHPRRCEAGNHLRSALPEIQCGPASLRRRFGHPEPGGLGLGALPSCCPPRSAHAGEHWLAMYRSSTEGSLRAPGVAAPTRHVACETHWLGRLAASRRRNPTV